MTLKRTWTLVLILGLLAGCGWMKELKMPVMSFFDSIRNGDIRGAYDQTSAAFQSSTDFDRFRQFLEGSGLINYESGSWPSVSFENETGKVEGTVTTSDGRVIPLTMHLVRYETKWQIQRIETDAAGVADTNEAVNPLAPSTADTGIPDTATLGQMAAEAVSRLGEAVNAGDYGGFHNWISDTWRGQIQPVQLQNAFQTFKEHNVDLTIVRNQTPVFDAAANIDDDGLLNVKGTFQTSPYNVFFDLSYINENGTWKLFGISVNVR